MNPQHARRLRDAGGIVMFSPMPPLANGIADYTAELLPALARHVPVLVVIDDRAPEPVVPAHCNVLRLHEYQADEAQLAARPHLYQLGNNADHVYLLPVLFRRPGVVVLHDVSLHHLVDQTTLRWGDETAYADWLELEYGHAGRTLARQFIERRWRPRSMFYELPMTREILTRARAVIAHSMYAATKAQAQALDTPVRLVRHHLAPSAIQARRTLDRAACRTALGVPQDATLLVSLGFVTRAKQIETVLRDLARRHRSRPDLRYVIAGQDEPEHFDVRALVASLGLQDVVHITGYVDEDRFYRWIAASDVVVNLRYPSGGETSGTLIRALGMGACVVVNDIGPFAEYPDEVCAKVPMRDLGRHDQHFAAVLDRLLDSPAERQRLARGAAAYMERMHAVEDSAAAYVELLARHGDRPVPALPDTATHRRVAAATLNRRLGSLAASQRHELPLWLTSGDVPEFAGPDDLEARVLTVGVAAEHVALLGPLFGHPPERVDRVSTPAQLGRQLALHLRRRSVALAVLRWNRHHDDEGLARLLRDVNALMRLDGRLLLALEPGVEPTTLDQAHGARRLVERHGFRCDDLTNGRHEVLPALDAPDAPGPAFDDGDGPRPNWLLVARKVSEFMPRRAAAGLVA